MSSEDNILDDDVGSSVENDCVEDDVGTSGIENTGEENAEHSDNEASGGRQRQQNPSQETSKESENSKDGERFKDEQNYQLIGRCLDEVVVNNFGNSPCRKTISATNKKESVNVKFEDSPSSEQMKLSTLVQAKSSAQGNLLVFAFKNSSENIRKKMRKYLEQFLINKQTLAEKSGILDLPYNSTYNTRVFVYALPFSIGVIPVPYEARYEHFRLSTFGRGRDLNLVQGVVMQLAREGFFCDITGSVVCFSCIHVITPNNLNHGLQHLRGILQNHICPMQDNVPIGEYGIDCAQLLGSASAFTPSGQPYQGHGVVQQNRLQPGVPYGRIVTSLTSFDQQNRLSHVNLASQGNAAQGYIDRSSNEVNEQEMETREGANIGGVSLQDGQPTSSVGGHSAGGTSHQSNTTQYSAMPQTGRACTAHGMKTTLPSGKRDREQWSRMECDRLGVEDGRGNQYGTHDLAESSVNHPDDSDLEQTFVRIGFSSHRFREAVRRLRNRRETIDYDSVMGELERIGAQPE